MRFTVLTATYNRAHLLGDTYQSLCAQTFRDFEWLIIDDGSTDGTRELVSSWKPFVPIRYFWKLNSGKHTALNLAGKLAAGEFITELDSDDRLVPHALERFDHRWKQLPDPRQFATLVSLCQREDETLLGSPIPGDYVDAFGVRANLSLSDADRWGVTRSQVWREFPYPEFPGERYLNPGVVHNRITRKYAVRYFNEALKIVGYAPGHMSGGPDLRWSSPRGAVVYHTGLALSDAPLKLRLKSVLNVARFAPVAGLRLAKAVPGLLYAATRHVTGHDLSV